MSVTPDELRTHAEECRASGDALRYAGRKYSDASPLPVDHYGRPQRATAALEHAADLLDDHAAELEAAAGKD